MYPIYRFLPACFIFLFFCTNLCAQKLPKHDHSETEWCKQMQSPRPNVLQAEAAFIQYFSENPNETSREKKLFVRWLEEARLSMDADGFHVPYTSYQKQEAVAEARGTGWRAIGPNHAFRGQCTSSSELSGGFCDRVYINPYNSDNLYAGFSYGGLWVSQDQGDTWTLADGAFANGTNTYANRDYYYGEIEAHKTQATKVFAATEAGLLRSTDAGLSWELCPQLNRNEDENNRPYFLSLSLTDATVGLATFGRKLYRTSDSGDTWNVVFDNSAGGANHQFTNQYTNNSTYGINERTYNFWGLEADPNENGVYYLGVWNANNEPSVFKSTDDGLTFSLLKNLNQSLGREMPNNLILKTLSSESDKFYVYSQFNQDTLYRMDSTGELLSKTAIEPSTNTFGTPVTTVECIGLNPLNENTMYAGFYFASSIMKSTNGGTSFLDMTSGYSGCPKYVHPDVRHIDVLGDLVLIGSDGGLAISKDAMASVSSDIGREISSIDLWGFASSPKSDFLAVGCDHGPSKIRFFDGDEGWYSFGGGDASRSAVNQSHDNWIYYQPSPGAAVNRRFLFSSTSYFTQALAPTATTADISNLEFHPKLWNTSFPRNGNVLQKSEDNFKTFSDLYNFGSTVNAVKVAIENEDIIYVLHNNRTIQRSEDGGLTWTVITPPPAATSGQNNVTDIAVGENPMHIWASYGNFQKLAKAVFSEDGGLTWTNITGTELPAEPVRQLIHQFGTDGGIYLAFAGRAGVWYKNNQMATWEQLDGLLPSLGYIRNIFAVPAKGAFRMGSSRGAWEHPLYEESTPVSSFAMDKDQIFCGDEIEFIANGFYAPGSVDYSWTFSNGNPLSSTLARPKVVFNSEGVFEVKLKITDKNGLSDSKTHTITVMDDGTGGCLPVSTASLFDTEIQYYPNPSSDILYVDLKKEISDLSVRLVDARGVLLLEKDYKNISSFELEMSAFPQGAYMLLLGNSVEEKALQVLRQ